MGSNRYDRSEIQTDRRERCMPVITDEIVRIKRIVRFQGNAFGREIPAHPRVKVHRQVTDMAGLMRGCDLAVTAGGTTVYELCALGVPFVCFSYAENQEALTAYVGQGDMGWNAGEFHHDPKGTLERIDSLVRQALARPGLRQRMSARARVLVDGRGAKRLAEALEAAAYMDQ